MSRGPNTTDAQRLAIIHWLKQHQNFNLITGNCSQGPVVAGVKRLKTEAYKMLATEVNRVCATDWTPTVAKKRYQTYQKLYKQTKAASERTGFGITDEDVQNGITSVDEKPSNMCPYFDIMDSLFGGRLNVTPANISEALNLKEDGVDDLEISSEQQLDSDQSQVESDPATEPPLRSSSRSTRRQSTPARRDYRTALFDAQDESNRIKKQKLDLERQLAEQEAEFKNKELELKKKEMELQERQFEAKEREETKRAVLTALIKEGKTPQQISQFLSDLPI